MLGASPVLCVVVLSPIPGALSGEHDEGPAEVSQEVFISACAYPPFLQHPTHPGSEQAGVCLCSREQEASALGEGEPVLVGAEVRGTPVHREG